MKKFSAECFGTFCLVFAGTGAIIINDVSGGSIKAQKAPVPCAKREFK